MKNWWLPYLLPVVTLIVVAIIAFSGNGITGLAAFQAKEPEVKINLQRGIVVPSDTLIQVSLNDQTKELTLKEFIEMTGKDYVYTEGNYEEIDYIGLGYTGPFEYSLRLSDLNLKGGGLMKIVIKYKDFVIWQDEKNVR